MVYPAVAALVKPVSEADNPWNSIYFLPVCCFLLRSACDLLGRSIATYTQWPGPGMKTEIGILVTTILRLGFIPLIMRCNVAPNNRTTEILFRSDAAYVVFMALFNIIGGYQANV